MSDEKSKVTDKASEIAKNIWLAGVGAYGKAVDEAQDRLEKAGVETPRLFKDLVKAGEELEQQARSESRSTRSSVEDRISRVRENFHNQRPARIEDLLELEAKVDLVSRKLDRLAEALTRAGLIEAPPEKPAGRKSAGAKKSTPKKKAVSKRKARAGTAASEKATARKGARKTAPAKTGARAKR